MNNEHEDILKEQNLERAQTLFKYLGDHELEPLEQFAPGAVDKHEVDLVRDVVHCDRLRVRRAQEHVTSPRQDLKANDVTTEGYDVTRAGKSPTGPENQ